MRFVLYETQNRWMWKIVRPEGHATLDFMWRNGSWPTEAEARSDIAGFKKSMRGSRYMKVTNA